MNKTLAGFFGIKAAAEIVADAIEAVVGTSAGVDASTDTNKETAAEGTPGTPEQTEETAPTVAETVTGEETDAPVDAAVGEDIVAEEAPAAEPVAGEIVVVEGEALETATGVATPEVEMAGLPAAELMQIRADAASWNTHKGEFAVLQNWYKNATGSAVVAATVDAADAVPGKKKSWETAPWNN